MGGSQDILGAHGAWPLNFLGVSTGADTKDAKASHSQGGRLCSGWGQHPSDDVRHHCKPLDNGVCLASELGEGRAPIYYEPNLRAYVLLSPEQCSGCLKTALVMLFSATLSRQD